MGACDGCRDCGGKPPKPESAPDEIEIDDEAVDSMVEDIRDIAAWEDAGFATDWSLYPFEVAHLLQYWRSAEREVNLLQTGRMQIFLKSWFKE